jgi:hypothetical protein
MVKAQSLKIETPTIPKLELSQSHMNNQQHE